MRAAWAAMCAIAAASCTLSLGGLAPPSEGAFDASTDVAAEIDGEASDAPSSPDAGDAMQPSDAAPDAPPAADGGASLCATAGVVFCDGFENGLGAWSTEMAMGGHLSVDTARFYRGTHSLHAHIDAINGMNRPSPAGLADHSQSWPQPLFVRMFVYMPSPFAPQSIGQFIDVIADQAPNQGVQLNARPTTAYFGGTGWNGLDTDWSSPNDLIALGAWQCIELGIEASGFVHVFVEDHELLAMQHTLPAVPPAFGVLKVGLAFFQAVQQPAYDAWIDEIAVDRAKIGCAR
jgi:hypothetical protein